MVETNECLSNPYKSGLQKGVNTVIGTLSRNLKCCLVTEKRNKEIIDEHVDYSMQAHSILLHLKIVFLFTEE